MVVESVVLFVSVELSFSERDVSVASVYIGAYVCSSSGKNIFVFGSGWSVIGCSEELVDVDFSEIS